MNTSVRPFLGIKIQLSFDHL